MTPKQFAEMRGDLTPNQREVLDQIGINNDLGHHPRTLDSLERRGLIESRTQIDHSGRFPLELKRYEMPLHVHYAWCAWCSQQFYNFTQEAGGKS